MTDGRVPDGGRRDSAVVAIAAVGLVAASWGALVLAPGNEETASGPVDQTRVALPERLPGFRPDLAWLPDDSLLGFVEVPAGPFTMGSDPGRDPLAFDVEWWGEGRVQGTPSLPTFWMARFETTVAQYAHFVNRSGHPVLDARAVQGPPDHPAAWVSWTDAVAYADWLTLELRSLADRQALPDGLARRIADGWTVSLPDEAQWEKAARGPDGRIYPWGDEPDPRAANYGSGTVAPVGSFACAACAHGLSDMAGNVWEWTRSPYQPYPFTDADDVETLRSEALWVMRGGSFADEEQMVRAANRGGADPGARRDFIGFRVVLTPPE